MVKEFRRKSKQVFLVCCPKPIRLVNDKKQKLVLPVEQLEMDKLFHYKLTTLLIAALPSSCSALFRQIHSCCLKPMWWLLWAHLFSCVQVRFQYAFETVSGFILPYAIIITSYVLILRRLRQTQFRRKVRSEKLILAIVVMFGAFWLPYHVINMIQVCESVSRVFFITFNRLTFLLLKSTPWPLE